MSTQSAASAASGTQPNGSANTEGGIPRVESPPQRATEFQNQNSNEQQPRNQYAQPASNQEQHTPTSSGSTVRNDEEDQPIENIGEALETVVFQQLIASTKLLPVALQRQVLDWTEQLLIFKDKIQTKKFTLEKLIQSNKPPKSAELKLEIRASERLQEAHKKELDSLRSLYDNGKEQFISFVKKFIVKVADLETSTAKVTLAEELFKMQIKFCKSLMCSKLARSNLTTEMIKRINNRSQKCAQRMVTEGMTGINMKINECIEMDLNDIVKTCKRIVLGEIIDNDEKDVGVIHENLLNYSITEPEEDAENADHSTDEATANTATTTGATAPDSTSQIFDFTSTMPNNMFKLNNLNSNEDWRKNDAASKEK